MNWTTEAPKLEGWYWSRCVSSHYFDIVEVRDKSGLAFFDNNDSMWRPLSHGSHFQWSGPIPQPGTADNADLLALLKEARPIVAAHDQATGILMATMVYPAGGGDPEIIPASGEPSLLARIDSAIAKMPPAGGSPGLKEGEG